MGGVFYKLLMEKCTLHAAATGKHANNHFWGSGTASQKKAIRHDEEMKRKQLRNQKKSKARSRQAEVIVAVVSCMLICMTNAHVMGSRGTWRKASL